MARHRGPGRPIKTLRPKRDAHLYTEDLELLVFMRKQGESIADVVHRVLHPEREKTS